MKKKTLDGEPYTKPIGGGGRKGRGREGVEGGHILVRPFQC